MCSASTSRYSPRRDICLLAINLDGGHGVQCWKRRQLIDRHPLPDRGGRHHTVEPTFQVRRHGGGAICLYRRRWKPNRPDRSHAHKKGRAGRNRRALFCFALGRAIAAKAPLAKCPDRNPRARPSSTAPAF